MVTTTAVQNNFIGGLKTEFTSLNFPENACTDASNCVFSLIGDVSRRGGINFETNFAYNAIGASSVAINTYRWKNAGGDGQTELLVVQVGATLYFFQSSASTSASPLSTQKLAATVTVTNFQAAGNVNTVSQTECQFSDGNGYLFVYHKDCDPFYCTFASNAVTANIITVQIRDFTGVTDGLSINLRPSVLTAEHQYNLQNQGWTSGAEVIFTETSYDFTHTSGFWINAPGISQPNANRWGIGGVVTFSNVPSGLSITGGQTIQVKGIADSFTNYGYGGPFTITGVVNNYTGTTLTATFSSQSFASNAFIDIINEGIGGSPSTSSPYTFTFPNTGLINTWNTGTSSVGGYPSNADVWWEFKDTNDIFDPATTVGNVTLNAGYAPKGYYIINAFTQKRTALSSISGITDITTTNRPRTGCWFQGRVWYTGLDSTQAATGDAQFYTWTENIYFSQIVTDISKFGLCYQTNDPTSENLNALLPTDGGVIVIQGSGAIHKLFPIQNGILVFANNGVWFITGSSGIGFTADDYTVTKISAVQTISSKSFVDVLGMPYFWNQEGIYRVVATQRGMEVEPLTVGTILSFYNNIPFDSKRYARGTYDPISYVISWVYRSTEESGIANRYQFDSVLNMRIIGPRGPEVAFYPYTISNNNNNCFVSGINYINYPMGSLEPSVKYLTTVNASNITFSEENDDTHWFDWFSYDNTGVDYTSDFTTGFNLHGQALLKWSNTYINIYSGNANPYAYTIQGIWDYANTSNSGRYTNIQTITNFSPNFNNVFRRHKIRGHGMSLQFKISSVSGQPFDIQGWSMMDDVDRGV